MRVGMWLPATQYCILKCTSCVDPSLIPFRDLIHAHVRADTSNSTSPTSHLSDPPHSKNPPSSPDPTLHYDIPTVKVRCHTLCCATDINTCTHVLFHGVFQENSDQYSYLVRPLNSSHPLHTTHDSNNYSKLNQVTP